MRQRFCHRLRPERAGISPEPSNRLRQRKPPQAPTPNPMPNPTSAPTQSLATAEYTTFSGKFCTSYAWEAPGTVTSWADAVAACNADSACGGFNYIHESNCGHSWCERPQYFSWSYVGVNCADNSGWTAYVKAPAPSRRESNSTPASNIVKPV